MSNSLFKETAGAEEQTVARQQETAIQLANANDGRVEKMGLTQDIAPICVQTEGAGVKSPGWSLGLESRIAWQSGKHEPVLRIHF